jgi:hypothetical protein
MKSNSFIATLVLMLLPPAAFAVGKPETPPAPSPIKMSQTQGQSQGQLQTQSQGQSQRAEAQALSNSESSAQAGSTATSSSGGNTQSTHIVTRESAAALAQGSLFLGDCGFAANGGGSGRGGAGFLGLAWQTPQCNDFKLAGYYFTIGDYATGCAIIAQTPAGKRQAKRGITLPQCTNPPQPVEPTPAPLLPTTITVEVKDDAKCKEKVDRVFERCVSK